MTLLNDLTFKNAIDQVNKNGFASLDLTDQFPTSAGKEFYEKMDAGYEHANRASYYNEIAFYWPEDWHDTEQGIGCFHSQEWTASAYSADQVEILFNELFGRDQAQQLLDFCWNVKVLTIRNHHGLKNNEVRLSRVLLRQMNESETSDHQAHIVHEDRGYTDRGFQQLLSVAMTLYGHPTKAEGVKIKCGDLLFFNALDRRKQLGLPEQKAFLHQGPTTGPKLFLFFEFLGPTPA